MTPSYDEIASWKPEALTPIANGLFALKANLDLEAPKAGNPVLNLMRGEWTGDARGPADDRAVSVTCWLQSMADEYGDLAQTLNTDAGDIASARTGLRNATDAAADLGYVLDTASRDYMLNFVPEKAPDGAEFDATTAAEIQGRLKGLGDAADQAVTSAGSAISAAVGELYAMAPESLVVNSGLVANQIEAFRKVYGREPDTLNDWRMAAALDLHSYNPKNQGVPPVISVIKIDPVPGQGVVATGLFIPNGKVLGGASRHYGDGREFDPNFAPENTRVSYFIDYENGIVIARQNPSADTVGQVRTGTPKMSAAQLPDGTVLINYDAADPLAPGPAGDAGWRVGGQTIVTPGVDGALVSGVATDFPSMETYQYLPDGKTRILHQDDSGDHIGLGPLVHLPFRHEYGDYQWDLQGFPRENNPEQVYGPHPPGIEGITDFGSADSPPTVKGAA
ncbi:hypothetical protein [Gordonia amicalis]|uniref:hypothetical protein n=1 Tax=Gordonia amicalis TaxID=89053 RepID=UPI001FB59C79|nr:hypothetical protein [Gordonia amicalis]MCZ4579882.1 hypothetical protein [Gordonia amicalis]UOG23111.1 hypothetical protein MTX80_09690 [Gordonia amicalis]